MIKVTISTDITLWLTEETWLDWQAEREEEKRRKETEEAEWKMLRDLRKAMEQETDPKKSMELWSFYSDVYKDIFGVRPH